MRKRNGKYELDFKNTCPVIDSNMKYVLDDISDILGEDPGDCYGAIERVVREALENVRETNVSMRSAADDQLNELAEEIETDMNSRISELERELADALAEVDRLS